MKRSVLSLLLPLAATLLLLGAWTIAAGPQSKKPQAKVRLTAVPGPVDPQQVQDQDDMTWDDYKPIPGINWADPSLKPEREFKMALVAVDFSDQPFVITQPKHSDLFGNPQIDPVKREDVPRFYADFWLKPSGVNYGQTINGYWMEQSRGKFGITLLEPFGPYRMPRPHWAYGLNEHRQNDQTPDGSRARYRMEPDVDSLWRADKGDIKGNYDAILRIYAGYDETGVWQEFGEMKFLSKDHIPAEWGNPNPDMPRWVPTRYVEWTSWKAGQMQWGLSSIRQGENSGTITHELGHFAFRIGDNNNNPYIQPYRRVGSGPWDMMDRGSFNGPGGPHMRWVVPPTQGAAMPAGLMLRNRMVNGFITDEDVITVSRTGLVSTGLVVARVTARAVEPVPGSFAGFIVRLDGDLPHDRTPFEDPANNPLSQGDPTWNFYSMEVIQRIGYDSFCPDNGVLLAKNKDREGRNGGPNQFNCFNWVIDANPGDINVVDYIRPDGKKVMRTVADYRQLNDALFHAGLNSGSEFEYIDGPNGLHFYILDIERDEKDILTYVLGVRSTEEKSARQRNFNLSVPKVPKLKERIGLIEVSLTNSDQAFNGDAQVHKAGSPEQYLSNDIYRISAEVSGEGWEVTLLNALCTAGTGKQVNIPLYVTAPQTKGSKATVTLSAVSESNPSVKKTVTIEVRN
ncbi:MAG: peptidase M6 [Bacteroidetes bacterium]|nr:peptidase M6 [Bacteroidota bacterium]